jgi:chaperonin GroES
MKTLRPLQDRVLVERIDAEKVSKGGIIIPDTAQEKPQQGKVVSTGKGRIMEDGSIEPPIVSAGDFILFGKYSGSEIEIDDIKYVIMREEDILAVIEGE